ncbi:hypothetical protein RQP53_09425 [Paucibacter sp. APW11]|uniref:Transmembrane protein n=1 Tax=Roseateles aquae TaxID=3077235 RepID=A0ABU3PAD4_9BURK|nr:hypothetical protein [Paucibacter sp. APW11]MDT8999485.1 hypothetical protein [Paucibacter sp. APW11]
MELSTPLAAEDLSRPRERRSSPSDNTRSLNSAVSWSAITAGAAAAASLSLILLILGVGLGLSSVSPWARDGVSAAALGLSTILWLTLTQLLASAVGGYLAGRLRVKWTEVHSDEVYFRDTAHGFLAWAMASLLTAALLGSVIGSILSGGVQAGASVLGGAATTASSSVGAAAASSRSAQRGDAGLMDYFVDSLFRRDASLAGGASAPTGQESIDRGNGKDSAEVSRIFMNVSRSDPLPPEDLRYVGLIVAQRTGLSQPLAEKRVAEVYARAQAKVRDIELAARETTDEARKASAYTALWLFVSLLVGAFVASLSATFGGRRRDA